MDREDDRIRILVLEDNLLTRSAVVALLQKIPDLEVSAAVCDGESAVQNCVWLEPDIVLADIALPGMSGIEAVRQIRKADARIKAIMLTAHDSDDDLFLSFQAGAEGYILKSGLTRRRLELAIKSVEDGSVWLDPLIADRVLLAAIANSGVEAQASGAGQPVAPLSGEERSVLKQVASNDPQCENGVCHVDPGFLEKLKRFSRQGGAPSISR